MACPMSNRSIDLTEKEIEKFCSLGCSVDCPKFFEEYLKEIRKKREQEGKTDR